MTATSPNVFFEETAKEMKCKNLQEYFDMLSSHEMVDKIRVPMLNMHSKDDFVCHYKHVPVDKIKANEYIIDVVVGGGGHIGYHTGTFRPKMVSHLILKASFHLNWQRTFSGISRN